MTVPIDKRFGRQAFGLNPAAYHSARPDYPDWVYDLLAARCGLGTRVFEIGGGTSKANHCTFYGFVMLNCDEIIENFRKGNLDIDCKRMTLVQSKKGGKIFEGQGYIRQAIDGALTFKIYVEKHNSKPFDGPDAVFNNSVGKIYADETYYDLSAEAHDGTCWSSSRILPDCRWNMADQSVLVQGTPLSMIAYLDLPQKRDHLVLHFFEEYRVPCHLMSEIEKYGSRYSVLDSARFKVLKSDFDVRVRNDSGDTVFDIVSDVPFPVSFDLRVQEALQFITAKTAIWRTRLQSTESGMELELASPRRKATRTQFSPPIAPNSAHFLECGWKLFEKYLAYVVENTPGTHWNPVAYHLYNACEATSADRVPQRGVIAAWPRRFPAAPG